MIYMNNDLINFTLEMIKKRSNDTEKHFFHLNSMLYRNKEVDISNGTWKLKQSRWILDKEIFIIQLF